MTHEIRVALRSLLRTPGFTAVAVLSLALGLGINTTIFSAVNGLLLRPLPVAEPNRLVGVFTSDYSGPVHGGSSWVDYRELRDQAQSFEALAAATLQPVALEGGDASTVMMAQIVSGNFFTVVGRAPLRGRLLQPADDHPGAAPVAVISEALWRSRYGGEEPIAGSVVRIAGQPFTIAGVAPAGFSGTERGIRTELWLPSSALPLVRSGTDDLDNRGSRGIAMLGLLRPNVAPRAAQAELATLAAAFHAAYPDQWRDVRGRGRTLTLVTEPGMRVAQQLRGSVIGASAMLLLLTALVLMVACANLANLLLARAARRRREIAVRLALGATRTRLVRQLLVESVLLAGTGGVLGIMLAFWGADLLGSIQPPLPVQLALDFAPDARVLGFAAALALLTGILMGLAPALQASRPDLASALKEGGSDTRRSRLRSAFVAAQVAFSLVLLIAAGLVVRSLREASDVEPGFSTRDALLATVDLELAGLTADRGPALFRRVRERLEALPGVDAVSYTTNVPLSLDRARRSLAVRGYDPAPGEDMEFHAAHVGPGYFETMGVPLVSGRGIGDDDRAGAPGVVVVNETFAERFWPGDDPIGKEVGLLGDQGPWSTVVGIARDGKYGSRNEAPKPFYYIPYEQEPRSGATFVVRTAGDPRNLTGPVRAAVSTVDPSLTVVNAMTLDESLRLSLLPARIARTLLAGFGLLALVLASLGVYGVMAYVVTQRTREMGIRIALGARSVDVIGMVLRYTAGLVAVGAAAGIGLALALGQLAQGLVPGVSSTDPLTYAAVTALLAAVALAAAWLPARRAAQVDPTVALRED